MLWLKALESLQAHFIKAAVADEVILGGYNPVNVRAKPDGKGILYLMRDRERPASDDLVESVRITLTVDAWVRSDSKEMHEGYEALARLERALMDALRRYAADVAWVAEGVQLLHISITETGGDRDSMRPLVGSRFTVELLVYEE